MGVLLHIPAFQAGARAKKALSSPLCLQMSSSACQLLHGGSVFPIFSTPLNLGQAHSLRIESVEQTLYFYIDDLLQFAYVSYVPEKDKHVGIFYAPEDLEIQNFKLFMGGQLFKNQPLAVPDAFFALNDTSTALKKYREIAAQFPGTMEGNKALFRAGVVQLASGAVNAASKEFSRLHATAAAPLACLGKSLVALAQHDSAEELAWAEHAFASYAQPPQILAWHNQVLSRLLEEGQMDRATLYQWLLLAYRYLPEEKITPHITGCMQKIQNRWDALYFIDDQFAPAWTAVLQNRALQLRLAFWLAKTDLLTQLVEEQLSWPSSHLYTMCNALFGLMELGALAKAEKICAKLQSKYFNVQAAARFGLIRETLAAYRRRKLALSPAYLAELPPILDKQSMRSVCFLFREAVKRGQTAFVYHHAALLAEQHQMAAPEKEQLDSCLAMALLYDRQWHQAEKLLSQNRISSQAARAFFQGCLLGATAGRAAAEEYFDRLDLDAFGEDCWALFMRHRFPQSRPAKKWLAGAFLWEKKCYLLQAALFQHCI